MSFEPSVGETFLAKQQQQQHLPSPATATPLVAGSSLLSGQLDESMNQNDISMDTTDTGSTGSHGEHDDDEGSTLEEEVVDSDYDEEVIEDDEEDDETYEEVVVDEEADEEVLVDEHGNEFTEEVVGDASTIVTLETVKEGDNEEASREFVVSSNIPVIPEGSTTAVLATIKDQESEVPKVHGASEPSAEPVEISMEEETSSVDQEAAAVEEKPDVYDKLISPLVADVFRTESQTDPQLETPNPEGSMETNMVVEELEKVLPVASTEDEPVTGSALESAMVEPDPSSTVTLAIPVGDVVPEPVPSADEIPVSQETEGASAKAEEPSPIEASEKATPEEDPLQQAAALAAALMGVEHLDEKAATNPEEVVIGTETSGMKSIIETYDEPPELAPTTLSMEQESHDTPYTTQIEVPVADAREPEIDINKQAEYEKPAIADEGLEAELQGSEQTRIPISENQDSVEQDHGMEVQDLEMHEDATPFVVAAAAVVGADANEFNEAIEHSSRTDVVNDNALSQELLHDKENVLDLSQGAVDNAEQGVFVVEEVVETSEPGEEVIYEERSLTDEDQVLEEVLADEEDENQRLAEEGLVGGPFLDEQDMDESLDGDSESKAMPKTPNMLDISLIIGIILIIVALAIGLSFIIGRGNDDDQSQSTTDPPTAFPTSAPTVTRIPFVLVSGPFTADEVSDFGFSASTYRDIAVVGAPRQGQDVGSVTSYLDIGGWIQNQIITGTQPDQQFGYSIDVQNDFMVVGAPGALAEGSDFAAVGAALSFQLDRQSSTWVQKGSTIRGSTDIDSLDEMFGATVASNTDGSIVAIGAPRRRSGAGGVYIFQYQSIGNNNTSDWLNMTSQALMLEETPEGSQFGAAVSVSPDGSRLVAGAPEWGGGRGYIAVYEWDETSQIWSMMDDRASEVVGGRFGAAVSFLDSETFVVGEPGAGQSGEGTLRVYRLQGRGTFQQLGPDIEGSDAGDALGTQGTLSGRIDSGGTVSVMAAKSDGSVDRYDYDGNRWIKPFTTVSGSGPVTSLDMSGVGNAFVVGVASTNTMSFYNTEVPVTTPTMSPSIGPTTPEVTETPTLMPTSNVTSGEWELTAYFRGDNSLGGSVAISADTMASGDSGSSMVLTYQLSGDSWLPAGNLTMTGLGTGFGASVALNGDASILAVGAPREFPVDSTATTTGAVYVYSSSSGTWIEGNAIRGAEGINNAGESFGTSLALSSDGAILAIGAPFNSEDALNSRGRVYTFQGAQGAFASIEETPLLGTTSGDFFGSAIAISNDGATLFVGAPGGESGSGYVSVYSFDGNSWGSAVATIVGSTAGEAFGTSVAVLSPDGSVFAAGAPSYNSGSGAVRVFQRQGDGSFAPLGDIIEGSSGAVIGGFSSISGSSDGGRPTLLVASSDGVISTYRFESGAWSMPIEPILTGLRGSPSLQGSTTLGHFVAGSRNEVVIYSLN